MNVIIPIIVEITDDQARALSELARPVWFDGASSALVLALLRSAAPALQE